MTPIVAAFWWALAVGAVVAVPVLRMLVALKSRQTVSQYAPEGHQKKQGTPTMGGILVLVAVAVAELIGGRREPLIPLLTFASIGFLDDFVVPRLTGKRGLGWKPKIGMQLMAGAICVWSLGVSSASVAVLGIVIILFCSNAYNFVDGLDGLAATVGILFAVGLATIATIDGRNPALAVDCAALSGGLVAFLFLNAPPARVFMGDVGSLPIGATFGWMVWQVATNVTARDVVILSKPAFALTALSLLLVVELVPVPLQIASVKLRKKRLFPMTPIHHAFEAAGWPESRVVWLFCLVQLILSVGAVSLMVMG